MSELSGRSHGRALSEPMRVRCTSGVMYVRNGMAGRVLQAGEYYDAAPGLVSLTSMSGKSSYEWEVSDAQ